MAWFYMQAMGNSTERIIAFDNVWNFDEDMLYDATVTLARTKSKEKNETILNMKDMIKSQFKDHLHLYSWANELYEKVCKKRSLTHVHNEFQTIDDPPETDKVGETEEVELTLVQELSQELESMKLKLTKMEQSSVEFMAYYPSGETSGYSDDRIANGTRGQSQFIGNQGQY